MPLNVIGSLEAPTLSWDEDEETIRDEIEGTVTSLLGLVGIDADPLGSREHVLIANLLEHSWRAGKSLDLGSLISQIQTPPLRKLGVFDVDAFMPPKDRNELAMQLNALVASPSFAAWGAARRSIHACCSGREDGKPRAAVVYLAHLSDQERQLVVTLVLSRLITWMHEQPGTSELRALVYLDEVFGFAPPTAAPPSKKPILTLMKQARAFGIGMVVATQNPVDLDYKAMANAGSWFVGRLQTENDKARVLEGLRSAAGGVDVEKLDTAIGALEQRQFLLQSAHRDEPELFATRWAMSFLRGPLTKDQIEILTPDEARTAPASAAAPRPRRRARRACALRRRERRRPDGGGRPIVRYLDPAAPWAALDRRRARRQAAAGIPRRAREPSLRRHEGRARHEPGVGSALRPARRRPRPRQRDRRRLRRARLSVRAARRGARTCSPRRRSTRSRSSARQPARSSAGWRTRRCSSSSAAPSSASTHGQARRKSSSRPGPTRPRRPARMPRRRRSGTGSKRSATGSSGHSRRRAGRSRKPTRSSPRASRPSSSPASGASSGSSSAARRTRARSRAPAGHSAGRPHAAA